MRASEYSVVSGSTAAVLAGEFGVPVNRSQRGAQFMAGIGDELAHPPIRRRDIGQRPFHVIEQSVQRVADKADLGARIGVLSGTRGVIAWWSRSSGSVATSAAVEATRSSGRSANRTIAIVHSAVINRASAVMPATIAVSRVIACHAGLRDTPVTKTSLPSPGRATIR